MAAGLPPTAGGEQRRPLGTTGLTVSPVAMGCWPIAGISSLGVNDRDSLATLRATAASGVNFLDTAYCYGVAGESEQLIGRVLAELPDDLVLATKGGLHYDAQEPPGALPTQKTDGRPETLRRECDESLSRLGVERVDLYYLHTPDPNVPVEESAGAIAELIAAGKVRAAGASNCTLPQIKAFQRVCPLAAVQLPYNMLQREIETETIPWCVEQNVAVVVYWALMKGLLAGKVGLETPLADDDPRRRYPMYQGIEWEQNLQLVRRLKEIADDAGKTVAQLAVNWTMFQPGITAVLCGAKRPEQIRETAGAMGWRLDASQQAALDEALAARGQAAVKRMTD